MTRYDDETRERYVIRVAAARASMEIAEMLGKPSPDWIIELVEEGDRLARQEAEARAGQTG